MCFTRNIIIARKCGQAHSDYVLSLCLFVCPKMFRGLENVKRENVKRVGNHVLVGISNFSSFQNHVAQFLKLTMQGTRVQYQLSSPLYVLESSSGYCKLLLVSNRKDLWSKKTRPGCLISSFGAGKSFLFFNTILTLLVL